MNIIFLGDIVGKIGRRAVAKILPEWKREYDCDFVIANGENLAHGKGFTRNTLDETIRSGVDFFTSGNHIAKKDEGLSLLSDKKIPMIRPANYPPSVIGDGYRVIETGPFKFAVINLIGRVFIKENFDCPFRRVDEILKSLPKSIKIILVDFHAEATSEKSAMGWYLDGRVSAVFGTHTHVQTSDDCILPNGTGFITDAGMCGAENSVIGVEKDDIIAEFLDQLPRQHAIAEDGPAKVCGIFVETDGKTGKTVRLERLFERVEI